MDINEYKRLFKILEDTELGNIIGAITNVFLILKKHGVDDKEFIREINDTIHQTKIDCDEKHIEKWWDSFDDTELLENMLTYRMKIDPYDFVNIFQKYTDYSTSDIHNFIEIHCSIFDENPEEYYEFL